MDINAKQLREIERGRRDISSSDIIKICEITGVNPTTLLYGEFVKKDKVTELCKRLDRLSKEERDEALQCFNKILDLKEM